MDASGVFPLTIGTTVYFTPLKTDATVFSSVIGQDGRYNVSLPPGLYTVHYILAGKRIVLLDDYNPATYVFRQPDDLDKENTIAQFLANIDWATNAVYDTFKDTSKTDPSSTTQIDLMHNLTNNTGSVVRYWALVFQP